MKIVAGRPEVALEGTYIVAKKLKVNIKNVITLVEERCILLSIPLILNDKVLFGYASKRIPKLLATMQSVPFDQGDLYGAIGTTKEEKAVITVQSVEHENVTLREYIVVPASSEFRILTFGVWIETVEKNLADNISIKGIINFDHLHKTADHAGILRDNTWDEMWARIENFW